MADAADTEVPSSAVQMATRANFGEAASDFEASLAACDFVAFDCEMTGVMGIPGCEPAWGDTLEARYQKMCKVVDTFSLNQVGFCTFTKSTSGPGYVAKPFTFYMVPDAKSHSRIVIYSSTVDFHRRNHFDFNAWLRDGIPFLSEEEHAVLREAATAEAPPQSRPARERVVITSEADKALMAEVVSGLRSWLGGEAPAAADPDEYALPECNAFMRRAIYEELEASFPELVTESRTLPPAEGAAAGSRPRRQVVCMRLSEEAKAARAASRLAERLEKLDGRAGLLRIWRALTASGKPAVGHNCMFDLLFMHTAFAGALPPTLAQWRRSISTALPRLYDTKHLAVADGAYPDTTLAPLAAQLMAAHGAPPVEFAQGFDRYVGGERCHEAGYDAYLTGAALASLLASGGAPDALQHNLYLMRSLYYVDLAADGEGDGRGMVDAEAHVLVLQLRTAGACDGAESAAAAGLAATPAAHAPRTGGSVASVAAHSSTPAPSHRPSLETQRVHRVLVNALGSEDAPLELSVRPFGEGAFLVFRGSVRPRAANVAVALSSECRGCTVGSLDEWYAAQAAAAAPAAVTPAAAGAMSAATPAAAPAEEGLAAALARIAELEAAAAAKEAPPAQEAPPSARVAGGKKRGRSGKGAAGAGNSGGRAAPARKSARRR